MPPAAAAQRIRRIADALAARRLPNDDDCRSFADALHAAIAGAPLLPALGLRGRWWAGLAAELLNVSIIAAAREIPGFGAARRDSAVADQLRERLSVYQSGTYRHDQRRG